MSQDKQNQYKRRIDELRVKGEAHVVGEAAQSRQVKLDENRDKRMASHQQELARVAKAVEAMQKATAEMRQEGYETFISAMLHILNHCRHYLEIDPLGNLIGKVFGFAANVFGEPSMGALVGSVIDNLNTPAEEPRPVEMADMKRFVRFTDDNKLVIEAGMLGPDGHPENQQNIQHIFHVLLSSWLLNHGYQPYINNKDEIEHDRFVQVAEPHNLLTKEDFYKLSVDGSLNDVDPEGTLDKLLSGDYDMTIDRTPVPGHHFRP